MSATSDIIAAAPDRSRLDTLAAHGVWAPPLIPLDTALAPHRELCLAHLRWLLARGCHGIALFGTTSEANSFSLAERMALLEHVVHAGLAPERLMVGTGCCAVPDSIRLTRHALELGCKKMLMLPPFYYKSISDEGLYQSYSHVIEAVADAGLRIILYHFPKMSAVPISFELIERLLGAYPGIIAGVKDSSGDWAHTAALLERFPALTIFPGSETLLLEGLRAGGAGCLTAGANINPAGIRQVFDAWYRGTGEAQAAQAKASDLRRVLDQHALIPALKHVLAHHQAEPQWRAVRPPLVRFDEAMGEALIAELDARGFNLA